MMARYYFYSAEMYYEDKSSTDTEVRRVGDYQGVYAVDDDSMPPDTIFLNLLEELKGTIPQEIKDSAYYHITQFNNVV
jgi:hypothetical protein